MTRAAAVVVSLGAAWLSAVGPAERQADAAAFTTRLDFATAPDCPDAAAFTAVVVARLGYDPFDRSAPDEVLVRIRRRGGTFDGRVEWRDAAGNWAGEQEFPSVAGDCARFSRQVAFAVAVQIQMLASAGPVPKASGALPSEPPAEAFAPRSTPPPAPPASPSTPTVPGVPAVATAALAPLRTTRAPLALAVGASTFVAAGLSSEPVPFGGVFGQLGRGHLALELAAVASVPTTTRRADGAGVSQQDLMLSAAGCGLRTRWRLCLLTNVGAVRMAGVDIDRSTSAVVPLVEAGARLAVVQRLAGRLFLEAHLDGLMAVSRWTATLDEVPVWTAPRFAAALGLDAGVRFPEQGAE